MNEELILLARQYCAARQLEPAESLGSGKDGIVVAAKNKINPANFAVKILRHDEAYWREKRAYERLAATRTAEVLGFAVPQMINSDDSLLVIEMTVVKRPFVLDFAGAYLDRRPEFSDEVWADWEAEKREQFEDRWPVVQQVIDEFEALGIYLMDVSPNNIGFSRQGTGESPI
jgi:hypothetical protein